MKMKIATLAAAVVAGLMFSGTARAADILCQNPALNHMLIDDSYVSACLDAGTGNISGNPANDPFLLGVGAAYELVSKSDNVTPAYDLAFTQNNGTGTFSFDASVWSAFSQLAIGFKFGTGNEPDEWFVYSLNPGVDSGTWEFVNVFGKGGGLSHANLYGIEGGVPVPEPTTLGLFGLGLLAAAVVARRRRAVLAA